MTLKNYAAICSVVLLLCVSVSSTPLLNDFSLIKSAAASSDPTITLVKPSPATVAVGKSIVLTSTVTDTSSGGKTTPTGKLAWSDGGRGGKFTVGGIMTSQCTLANAGAGVASCKVTYRPPPGAIVGTKITINATYSGDTTHQSSKGSSSLTVLRGTSTLVTLTQGVSTSISQSFNAFVMDTSSGVKGAPTGKVTWVANVTGGHFQSTTCTLAQINSTASKCSVAYNITASPGGFAIMATYGGDSSHVKSTGKSVDLAIEENLFPPGPCLNGSPCYFNPMKANIKAGNNVIWHNTTPGITHTVTSDTGDAETFSAVLASGDTFSRTFANVGTFGYHCMIHPFMTGIVNAG